MEFKFMTILSMLVAAVFSSNIVLSQTKGICPFLGVSKKTSSAMGMGVAVIFVTTMAVIITYPIYKFVMMPLGIEYMDTIIFILVIASVVQIIELVIKKYSPTLYNALGVYLPLITTNCVVLAMALEGPGFIGDYTSSFADFGAATLNALFAGVGFLVAIVILSAIRERIERNDIPKAFRGFPITLIAAGIMALAFHGLSIVF